MPCTAAGIGHSNKAIAKLREFMWTPILGNFNWSGRFSRRRKRPHPRKYDPLSQAIINQQKVVYWDTEALGPSEKSPCAYCRSVLRSAQALGHRPRKECPNAWDH